MDFFFDAVMMYHLYYGLNPMLSSQLILIALN